MAGRIAGGSGDAVIDKQRAALRASGTTAQADGFANVSLPNIPQSPDPPIAPVQASDSWGAGDASVPFDSPVERRFLG